jgi:hypothetical protein
LTVGPSTLERDVINGRGRAGIRHIPEGIAGDHA